MPFYLSVCLPASLSVCLSVSLSVRLFVCRSTSQSPCVCVCLPACFFLHARLHARALIYARERVCLLLAGVCILSIPAIHIGRWGTYAPTRAICSVCSPARPFVFLISAGLSATACALVVVLALTANRGPSALLEIDDGEVLYQPRRAHISFLPIQFLDEVQYPPSYNNHVLRESACFGFDRNPGYESWTPDGEYSHPIFLISFPCCACPSNARVCSAAVGALET